MTKLGCVFMALTCVCVVAFICLQGCSHTPPTWDNLTDRELMEQAAGWHSTAMSTVNTLYIARQISYETVSRVDEIDGRYSEKFMEAENALAEFERTKTTEAEEAFRAVVSQFRLVQAEFIAAFGLAVGEAAD